MAEAGSGRTAQRWRIAGRVQGVGYRAWMVAEARALGVDGSVWNRRDGQVEAVLAGAPEALARLHDACRQGPPGARVTHIEITAEPGPAPAPGAGFAQAASR